MIDFQNDKAFRVWTGLARAQSRIQTEIETALKTAGLPPLAWYDVLLELERHDEHGLRPMELEFVEEDDCFWYYRQKARY